MKIKHILYSLCLVGVLGMIFTLGYAYKISQDSNQLNQARLDLAELEINLLNMRRNEKDFMARMDLKYLAKFEKNSQKFMDKSQEISQIFDDFNIKLERNDLIKKELEEYQVTFKNLINAYQVLGLTQQNGLLAN